MAQNDTLVKGWQPVIGLEVHVQILTNTKLFSPAKNKFGEDANTLVDLIDMGLPGVLPVLNEGAMKQGIKFGLATSAKIAKTMIFDRKNYFYPDLPKGYQITQDNTPICTGGFISIKDVTGNKKDIKITRIHMEEDAGKSIHDLDPFNTLIDLNRAGVPLIEIVSEPDLRTSDEAYQYINAVRKIVRYLDICDGNMEEGSLRCDANISVRLKGNKKFGTKVEVKNMNSSRNVKRAIEFEIGRQIKLLESGKEISHETRSFNANKNTTISMRHKEEANDYRYFPEPDLQPIIINKEYIKKVKAKLPPLPSTLFKKFTEKFGLSEYDANILIDNKATALYYYELCTFTNKYKSAANFMNGSVKSYLNENAIDIKKLNISPKQLASLITLVDSEKVSHTVATLKIFPEMLKTNDLAEKIAIDNHWLQEKDSESLNNYIRAAILKYPDKVNEYKNGKKGVIGLFMGEVMKLSKGKADPKLANKLLQIELEK